jgi:enoyl-CoA hydratase/carnithine racemase
MATGTEDIEVTRRDGVQVLRLARAAKKNALTSAMYTALADGLQAGDSDPAIGAHVFMGSGGVFSAGNDIVDFMAAAKAGGALGGPVERFVRLLPRVAKPMIAAVDGPAVGVGATMLLHCDLVYATPAVRLSMPFLDLGLVPEAGSSLLLPLRIGYVRAFEMLVLGETFDGERARDAGLVNRLVAADQLEAIALDAARRLCAKPPEALAIARRLMRGDATELEARMSVEVEAVRQRLASPEAMEAFQAFVEKRPPVFRRA